MPDASPAQAGELSVMNDRIFFGLIALAAVVMIALALVWPQGLGARSPGAFGRPEAQSAPAKPSTQPIE